MRAILRKELDLALFEIADPNAKLEGGDVLFTGKEFFVGISEFTNEAGARSVANAFPEFPCVPIKVRFSTLRLILIYLKFPITNTIFNLIFTFSLNVKRLFVT